MLCIVELNGNLHFELFLILFLCLAILNYNQSHLLKSGFNLGLSVISKLNSFLFGILFLSKSDFIKKNVLLVFGFNVLCLQLHGLFYPVSMATKQAWDYTFINLNLTPFYMAT